MKNFYFEGRIYKVEEFDFKIHKNIKCEFFGCRIPIKYIPHPKYPYFRVAEGLEHVDGCPVCSKKTKKGNEGKKVRKIKSYEGKNYWSYGLTSNYSEDENNDLKSKNIQTKERKIINYKVDDNARVGAKNLHIKNLNSIKKLINKERENWEKIKIEDGGPKSLYSKVLPTFRAKDIIKEEVKEKKIIIGKITSRRYSATGGNNLFLFLDNIDFRIFIPESLIKKINAEKLTVGSVILAEGTLQNYFSDQLVLRSNQDIELLNIEYNYKKLFIEDFRTKKILEVIKNKGLIEVDIEDLDMLVNEFLEYEPSFIQEKDIIKKRFELLIKENIIENKSYHVDPDEWVNVIIINNYYK